MFIYVYELFDQNYVKIKCFQNYVIPRSQTEFYLQTTINQISVAITGLTGVLKMLQAAEL